ncbi:natural resistance-associated macrophage protein-domain-containing protein, partial [Halteromyces radiatus]|uniref:natural resistance-associated macrophage protein-domain-containing protein n=1 Tax=Halteromyces radiatus TaxID=101107 RepID=UPI00221ED1B0
MGTGIIVRTGSYLRRLLRYIGPGFMIAVGYLDPGNWSVDMEGGSRFGYTLLFVILVSNVIAIFLQNLAIRLGTVSGLDLAAASRHHLPRPLNLFLYVISEIGIIMTDLAEVIGSAIALTLLFPSISLPMGVAITALDVLIILLFYKEDQDGQHDMRFVHYFEWFVMALVSAVGICFIIELTFSPVVMSDVMRGFLPSSDIFLDKDCLYVAIGIIGATVMPHNLFLHSFIVQSRCYEWRSQRPLDDSEIVTESALAPTLDSSTLPKMKVDDDDDENDSTMVMIDERHNKRTIDQVRQELEEHVGNSLHYGLMDLVVALCFAFFINAAILIVASANFHHEDSATVMSDLFDAHGLLRQYIGPVAAFVFAIALLCAGQSSTLTATLAGQ